MLSWDDCGILLVTVMRSTTGSAEPRRLPGLGSSHFGNGRDDADWDSSAGRILKAFSIEMNRRDDKKHSPARVYAQFTSVDEKGSAIGANSECKHEGSLGNRREIQITESGEVSHPPDKARVSIVCTNAKVRTHR